LQYFNTILICAYTFWHNLCVYTIKEVSSPLAILTLCTLLYFFWFYNYLTFKTIKYGISKKRYIPWAG
jgi:hypothetical protein